ncbi:hypothetical protein CYMTET_50789 [Cymbomonas tetramitiformis]|uniref:No apical meristem-associated C-terminal domain-containing protein n=1 Tax=Cymbomonas tetramitiformis TaxID=36881 RepID=A0AAE0EST2_9CHLO|nr:hypothetical protein CYMTET_50789 [Cymbomonas tetramitiformis]
MIEKWGKEDSADDKESGGSSNFEDLHESLTQLSGKWEIFKLAKSEKREQGKPKKAFKEKLGLDERRIALEEQEAKEEQKDRQLDREERAADTTLRHETMKALLETQREIVRSRATGWNL